MVFRTYIFLQEALKIVKKLKDKIADGDSEAFKYLILGKIDGFSIKKSKHILDTRNDIRRDIGVPENFVLDIIKKAFSQIKNNKDTIIIFTYKEHYNMLIVFKSTKFKQLTIKTEILQNRNKNTFKYKDTDDSIILETINDIDIIYVK